MHARSSTILSGLLLLIVPAMTIAQIIVTVDGQETTLRDIEPNAWYATYVRDAVASHIVGGYRDEAGNPLGLFGPANNITLAETLKIAVEGAGYDVEAYGSVPSTMTGHWAIPYLNVAAHERFTVFETQQNIDRQATRAEVASLFTDAFDVDTVTPVGNRYDDVGFSTPHVYSIEALSRDKVLTGDTDVHGNSLGRFRPLDAINRAEVTKMIMLARAVYGTNHRGSSSSRMSSSRSSSSSSALSSSSMSSMSSTGSSVSSAQVAATVTLLDAGMSPMIVIVSSGATVRFFNDSTGLFWVASDPHPQHSALPGFDSQRSLIRGEEYRFTFKQSGTWGFHNHANPTMTGAVVVQ